MTLGSGSYTQQSTSHAIARAQGFTRPSSNSPRALATHWHTAAAASGTVRVYVFQACHRTVQRKTPAVHHNRQLAFNPTHPLSDTQLLEQLIQQHQPYINSTVHSNFNRQQSTDHPHLKHHEQSH